MCVRQIKLLVLPVLVLCTELYPIACGFSSVATSAALAGCWLCSGDAAPLPLLDTAASLRSLSFVSFVGASGRLGERGLAQNRVLHGQLRRVTRKVGYWLRIVNGDRCVVLLTHGKLDAVQCPSF